MVTDNSLHCVRVHYQIQTPYRTCGDHSSIFFPSRSELLVCPILVLATPIKILHSSRVLPFSEYQHADARAGRTRDPDACVVGAAAGEIAGGLGVSRSEYLIGVRADCDRIFPRALFCGLGFALAQEVVEVEPVREHRQRSVGLARPLFLGPVPIQFDAVLVGIAQVSASLTP